MIDVAKIAAEATASGLGRDAVYRGPGVALDAEGMDLKVVPSLADATVSLNALKSGRMAPRFRVYCAEGAIVKGGSLVCDARVYRLTSEPEAADRGRYSWFVGARDEGAAP